MTPQTLPTSTHSPAPARSAAAANAANAPEAFRTLDPDVLALAVHELRDLLAPVIQCAAILRMSATPSATARVNRTSDVLARNVRALQQVLEQLEAARSDRVGPHCCEPGSRYHGSHLHRS